MKSFAAADPLHSTTRVQLSVPASRAGRPELVDDRTAGTMSASSDVGAVMAV
jgi:hypothetical protein